VSREPLNAGIVDHLAASGWLWLHFESGLVQNQSLGPDLYHSSARNQALPSDSACGGTKTALRHAARSRHAVAGGLHFAIPDRHRIALQ